MQASVKENRELYIGGSDIPIIMGISQFKSRFDLLLEKAGLKDDNFEGNEYTEYGNIMEPKIRNYINGLGLSKNPYKEDKKYIDDIRCHVDGFNGDTLLEIKTTSQLHSDLNGYKVYLVQLLFYMQCFNVNRGCLAVYERPADFDETFDEKRLTTYYLDINNYKDLLDQINKAVDQFRIDLAKVKENPFITEQELLPVDLTELSLKVVELENQLVAMKQIEAQAKDLKAQLKSAMEKYDKKTWETPNGIKITLVYDTPDKEVEEEYYNEEMFIADNFELHEAYHNKLAEYKETRTVIKKGRAGYVKVTLPKEENNE